MLGMLYTQHLIFIYPLENKEIRVIRDQVDPLDRPVQQDQAVHPDLPDLPDQKGQRI
jgi:hypothetical protein